MCETNMELRVDRIENGIAVAYSDTGREYRFAKRPKELRDGDIIRATIGKNGEIIIVEILGDKTTQVKVEMQNRLHKLFNK